MLLTLLTILIGFYLVYRYTRPTLFQQDLEIAHKVERAVIPHLTRFMPGSEAWVNRLSPFICDLWWKWPGDKPCKVEVKFDRMASRTGNIALEHRSLLKSTSQYVVYVFDSFTCLYHITDIR